MPKTATSPEGSTRSYGDACRVAHALDIVGDRWSLLVVRELILGPKRFTDLSAGLPRATRDMLTRRLRDLERNGVLTHRRLGAPYGGAVYELTDWGRMLEPLVIGLGEWGARSPVEPREPETLSPDAFVLALRTHFVPSRAKGRPVRARLVLGDFRYRVVVQGSELEAVPGELDDPDVTISGQTMALADALFDPSGSIQDALRAGEVGIEGDEAAAIRLFGMFAPLEPVASS